MAMGIRRLGGCALVSVGALVCVAAAGAKEPPGFALSTTTALHGDTVEVRVRSGARALSATTRLYLVPANATSAVRSRLDRRLYFIGTLGPSRGAVRAFTVPPVEPGTYSLAYWCRGCLPSGVKVAIEPAPRLRVRAPLTEGCPITIPNANAPPGVARSTWKYHGNGHLAVLLPPETMTLTTNALGGYKMFWVARQGLFGAFRVSYQRVDMSAPPFDADTVSGSLGGYSGPSWASRMSFDPGCWEISARVFDVTLAFVAEVSRGNR